MSEETLFTSARRVIRNFGIDMERGGLITPDTLWSMDQMRKQVEREDKRQKEAGEQKPS